MWQLTVYRPDAQVLHEMNDSCFIRVLHREVTDDKDEVYGPRLVLEEERSIQALLLDPAGY